MRSKMSQAVYTANPKIYINSLSQSLLPNA